MSDDLFLSPEQLARASAEELQHYLKLLQARKALQSPLDYAMYCTPGVQAYKHSVYLNEVLVALVERRLYKSGPGPVSVLRYRDASDLKGEYVHPVSGEPVLHRLGVSMPPQVGKSLMVGESFCPWYMRTHKDENVLYITYASPLAEKISRKAMATIERTPELGNSLDPARKSIKNWAIDGGMGEFLARGVTGSVTGFGGNVIFDDPHANGIEAASEIERNKVLDLWDSSLATRTGGGFKWAVVIQTRWHEDDLVGHLQENDYDKWFWVVLPALAYDDVDEDGISVHPDLGIPDPLGRKPGESICPELFAKEDFYAAEKREPYWYGAEYQQLPQTAGEMFFREEQMHYYNLVGGIYEIFRPDGHHELVAESDCYRFGIMDLATKEKQSSDYTVLGIFDVTPSRKLLLRNIFRARVPSDKHVATLNEQAAIFKPEWVGIEDVTYGTALIQSAIAGGSTVFVRPLKPGKQDKRQRAIPLSILMSNAQYYIAKDAPWTNDYVREMLRFLRDTHDDQVDVSAYAALQLPSIPTHFRKTSKEKAPDYGAVPARGTRKPNTSHEQLGNDF